MPLHFWSSLRGSFGHCISRPRRLHGAVAFLRRERSRVASEAATYFPLHCEMSLVTSTPGRDGCRCSSAERMMGLSTFHCKAVKRWHCRGSFAAISDQTAVGPHFEKEPKHVRGREPWTVECRTINHSVSLLGLSVFCRKSDTTESNIIRLLSWQWTNYVTLGNEPKHSTTIVKAIKVLRTREIEPRIWSCFESR